MIQAIPAPVIDITEAQQTRIICVSLVLESVVSYRSVPRILNLLNTMSPLALKWIPHFTSVINWTLRLGLGLLKNVQPICEPWVAIMDHSIDIGTKKVLVVLRVKIDALSNREKAITLKDCECIGMKISETVNGETVALALENIFTISGTPCAILKDCDHTLGKGVRLWSEKQRVGVPVIDDISHVIANVLKEQFGKNSAYQCFVTKINHCAKCLRQTDLAFLMPPKLRTKGRFLSIGKLGKWAEKIINIMAIQGRAKKGSLLERLRKIMPNLRLLTSFITRFANMVKIASQIMKVLKNKGLDQRTYQECQLLLEKLPNSKVKSKVQLWLQKHIKLQLQISNLPLLVSSDIIESLFGRFKHIIERSPQADMNRTTLLIPTLCGNIDELAITRSFKEASHNNLINWEQENIPYTIRKKRQDFFAHKNIQKAVNS